MNLQPIKSMVAQKEQQEARAKAHLIIIRAIEDYFVYTTGDVKHTTIVACADTIIKNLTEEKEIMKEKEQQEKEKAKYTTSEWEICGNGIFKKGESSPIAIVTQRNYEVESTGEYKTDFEKNANAKLIAAAPDLLEALESLVKAVEDDLFFDEIKKAKQAIKKATE